jgi:hypothetical protein
VVSGENEVNNRVDPDNPNVAGHGLLSRFFKEGEKKLSERDGGEVAIEKIRVAIETIRVEMLVSYC